jgi:hypothetical protein
MSVENKKPDLEDYYADLEALSQEELVTAKLRQSGEISDRTNNSDLERISYQRAEIERQIKQAERAAMGHTGLRRFFSGRR